MSAKVRAREKEFNEGKKAYQRWVDEAKGWLAGVETLLVDSVEDGGEDGGRGRGAADEGWCAGVEDYDVVADGADAGWVLVLLATEEGGNGDTHSGYPLPALL